MSEVQELVIEDGLDQELQNILRPIRLSEGEYPKPKAERPNSHKTTHHQILHSVVQRAEIEWGGVWGDFLSI